jgi:small-conductance mechanosensitive channel
MFDLSQAWTTIQRLGNSFVAMVPRLILAALLAWAFTLVGRLARRLVERGTAKRREHRTLQLALGRLVQAGIVVVGLLVAATAAFPTFTMANLVGTLGVGGVAIGFAFKDIFQNFLAGILLLLTKPFGVGDQIIYKDFEGTVEDIQTRATLLKTYDGRRVVIPNSDLYLNAVTVNTAFPIRRIEHDVGIAIDDDVNQAKRAMVQVMRGIEGVLRDPSPDVLVVGISDLTVILRARWWSTSEVPAALLGQDRVLSGIKTRLQSDGIHVTGRPENSALTTVAVRATETEGTSGDAHEEEAPANT